MVRIAKTVNSGQHHLEAIVDALPRSRDVVVRACVRIARSECVSLEKLTVVTVNVAVFETVSCSFHKSGDVGNHSVSS